MALDRPLYFSRRTMMSLRRLHAVATAVMLTLVAACKDSQGPGSLSDPAAVTTELAAMDSAFASAAFESYASLAVLITPAARGALARAATVVDASTPELVDEPVYLRGARRAAAWHKLLPSISSLSAGPLIPAPILATTYEWDVSTSAYAATARAGAPTNGVRFILYTVNPITHEPAEPLVEVGFVDLMDESADNTLRLHIQIKGTGGSPTYLDYTAVIVPGAQSFTATVSGSLNNGAAAGANKTLTFNLSFAVDANTVTANASFDLNNPSVSVDVYQRLFVSNTAITMAVDFRFARPGELVRITGSVSLTPVGNEFTISGNMIVTVNDGIFARLTTNGQTGQWTKHDGTPLTAPELAALEDLFDAVERFFDFVEDLLQPVDDLIDA